MSPRKYGSPGLRAWSDRVSATPAPSMKRSILPSESQVMSTMVQSRVGGSSRRCSGTMGKSWSKAQWSGALWKGEKFAMYWSAILSPRAGVLRGGRVVGAALEEQEVRHVLIGDLVPQVARVAREPLLAAVQGHQPAAELPEEALHRGALLEAEDAQLEHLQGLLLLGHRVVVGLGLVARGEAGHDLAHLPHDADLVLIGHRGAGELVHRADLDMAEDVHHDAGLVGGDRPARL